MCRQVVPERLHLLVSRTLKWHVRNLVEPYEVDTAIEPFQQLHELLCMGHTVVDAAEYDIFKRQASLV